MDFHALWRPTLLAASLALAGCGGSDSGNDTSPAPVKNVAPTITSTAPVAATEDVAFSYQLVVQDPNDQNNGTDLRFTLENAPAGMGVTSTGLVTWTPLEGVLSSGAVTVTVADGGEDGAAPAKQTFTLSVTAVNDAPTLAPIALQTLAAGETLSLQLAVTDSDDANNGTDLHYQLLQAPEGMTVSATGLISYTSAVVASRSSDIRVEVRDGGEDGAQAAVQTLSLNEQFFVAVNGRLNNFFNGEAIAEGVVEVSDGQNVLERAVSDAHGKFVLKVLDTRLGERTTVSADAEGFGESAVSLSRLELSHEQQLLLQPVHAALSFDATAAAELAVLGQTLVSLPANALVDEAGNPVATAVAAELTVINPALNINLMPGEMNTRDANGVVRPIESFGAITVTFEDTNGKPLQLGAGKKAQINIPAVSANGLMPDTVPLYYYDPVSGFWVEEGEAELTEVNGQSVYQGEVSHFTTWNADMVYDTVDIRGCVVDTDGNKVANARLESIGRTYLGRASSYSDGEGNFVLQAKRQSEVMIAATSGQQSRTLVLQTADVEEQMAACLVLSNATSKITLTWGERPYDLDSHLFLPNGQGGLAHIYFANEQELVGNSLIYLDVDDVTSYGPEVITLPTLPVAGKYSYYVHNYSGSPLMAPAETRVELILEGQRWLFTPLQEGVSEWWHVFDLQVAEDGTGVLEPVNQWKLSPDYVLPQGAGVQRAPSAVPDKDLLRALINSKYYQ